MMPVLMTLLFLVNAAVAKRLNPECSNVERAGIDVIIDSQNNTVDTLFELHQKIEKCSAMDGYIAEGFQDLSNRLLAENWKMVVKSEYLNDQKFRSAVLMTISDGSGKNVFNELCANAKDHPKLNSKFAEEVSKKCVETEEWIRKELKK